MAEEELVDMTFFVDLVSELREKLGKMPTAKQLVDNCQALTVAEAKEVLAAMPKLPPLAKKQKRTPVEPTQSPEVPAEPAAAAAPSEKAANGGQDRFTNALVPQAEGQGVVQVEDSPKASFTASQWGGHGQPGTPSYLPDTVVDEAAGDGERSAAELAVAKRLNFDEEVGRAMLGIRSLC